MVKSDTKKIINIDDIDLTDVMVGGDNKQMHLYYQLVKSFNNANQIDIIVAFLMESGVRMLLPELRKAVNRGASVRILTGNYLGITQPSALYLIRHEFKDKIDLRFYNEKNRSFHPKSYIFHYKDYSEIYVGSSNISRSALTSAIEWNYRFNSKSDSKSYYGFYATFEDLFENNSTIIDDDTLKKYSNSWHKPSVSNDLDKYDEDPDTDVKLVYEPRGAQIEALCALENTRSEGATKALIQAATGVGKTYLAAFDSKKYERVLFIAHREEILKQAATSFYNVRNSDDYGFFNGDNKTYDKPVIFASVSTLGNKQYLNEEYFERDYFDYIVVDEFHHAVCEQYTNIIEYFKPKFLLGLTATPERMDGKNIFAICDYNVPFEISLKDAINKGMLVPFHYYGIYDDIDYSKIIYKRGRYDLDQLNETYIGNNNRNDLIFKSYLKYSSKRALGFCCSRKHAQDMAKEFTSRGIPSVAVYSGSDGEYSEDRKEAIDKLTSGEIKVIFSVDMFNEGVDIPSVDMVLFLRPTESPIIFLQQLGRGLRKDRGKEYLNVLDFIGNYEKAGKTRYLLTGNDEQETRDKLLRTGSIDCSGIADGCMIDFDLKLIDLFVELERKNLNIKDIILMEFNRVREYLDKIPTRLELFTYMDDNIYQLAIRNSKFNPFKDYLQFLNDQGLLTSEQKEIHSNIGGEFISLIEKTNMQKVYKMPVLMAFYNNGNIRTGVNEEQLLTSWKQFFNTGTNWKDLDKDITYDKYKNISDKAHIKKIIDMPIRYLFKSGEGFFIMEEGSILALNEQLKNYINNPEFIKQMEDIIKYRTMDYYQRRYNDSNLLN